MGFRLPAFALHATHATQVNNPYAVLDNSYLSLCFVFLLGKIVSLFFNLRFFYVLWNVSWLVTSLSGKYNLTMNFQDVLNVDCVFGLLPSGQQSGCVIGVAIEDVDRSSIGLWLAVIEIVGATHSLNAVRPSFEMPSLLTQDLSGDLVLPSVIRPAVALIDRIVSQAPGGLPTVYLNVPLRNFNRNCLIRKKVRTDDFQKTFMAVRCQAEKIVFGLSNGPDKLFKDVATGSRDFSLSQERGHPPIGVDCSVFAEFSKLTNIVLDDFLQNRDKEVKKSFKYK